MTNEIAKKQFCVLIRGGVEIWVDEENIQAVKYAMEQKGIIDIDGNIVNTVDISGIFSPDYMAERSRRKNGQWQDSKGTWHDRGVRVCKCGNELPPGMTCGNCRN